MNNVSDEEDKILWVELNTFLNGEINNYDWLTETKLWAGSKNYFPELSWEEFLAVARKYDHWRKFEDAINKKGLKL